jgi:hypothetical protein
MAGCMRILIALALLLAPALASAQASSELADPADTTPTVRLDVGIPAVGFAVGTFERDALMVGGHLTFAHRSGHGARVAITAVVDTSGTLLGPHDAHGQAWLLETGYVHRFRLVGNDRVGLGLDVSGGLSGGEVRFHQATNGLCWGSCGSLPVVEEHVSDGAYLGANVGASLDLRLSVFVMGIDLRYHPLIALAPAAGDELMQHLFTASAYLGFGFH